MKEDKSYPPVNIKKRVLTVVCCAFICTLIGLILSAAFLEKDVRSTAQVTLEVKNRSALKASTADIEKSIALYRDTAAVLENGASVKELRQRVSFADDDVLSRQIVRNLQSSVGSDGQLTLSFTVGEAGASVSENGQWATQTLDRSGNVVISFALDNINPKVTVKASASTADKAAQTVQIAARQLAFELFGSETLTSDPEAGSACYTLSAPVMLLTDERVWPDVWSFVLFGFIAGLLISFLACFILPAIRKQFLLKWWQKLLIIVLCTALAAVGTCLFCEKIVKARYVDTLSASLSVDESGEKALLAARGDEFGEKVYNVLSAFSDQIGTTANASKSNFYKGVYLEISPIDPNIEKPRSGLQAAITQTVDEGTGTVIFTVKTADDVKAQRIATAAANELGVLMFGSPVNLAETGAETEKAAGSEQSVLYMSVELYDPEPDSGEVHLYQYRLNGQEAADQQVLVTVEKVEADENAKAAGNVQWEARVYVSEQNVIEQLQPVEAVRFYGQKLDLYDGVTAILADSTVYEQVVGDMKALGRKTSVKELADTVRVSTSASNRALSLSVTDEDADKAADIVTSLVKRVSEAMFEGIDYGAEMYAIISAPSITQSQVRQWPATITWVIAAALIALLASYIIFSQQSIFDSLIVIFFVVFTILCVFPFYYLFINTISDNELVAGGRINFFPRGLHITNYLRIFKEDDVGQALKITVLRTLIGTVLMVFTSAWAGYLVTKQKMWKRSLWYRALVVTMYFNAGLIPWYTNMLMLGLTNNFLAYLIPGMVAPYNIILVKTYIESIPGSLEESAIIDGASTTQVFMRIILPLSIPILATIAIFGAVGNWNAFQDSLLLMSSNPKLYTLQHRLYIYLNQTTSINTEQLTTQQAESLLNTGVTTKYTIAMVTIIPILLVYPFMQRYFVKGIMLGAVKG